MITSVQRIITITVSFEKISVADVMEINLLCKDFTKIHNFRKVCTYILKDNSYFNLFT